MCLIGGSLVIDEDCHTIYMKWLNTLPEQDGYLAGIIADYLEDNIDTIRYLNPKDERLIQRYITFFRERFLSSKYNCIAPTEGNNNDKSYLRF